MLTVPFGYINYGTVEFKLKMQLIISTILMSLLLVPTTLKFIPDGGDEGLLLSFAGIDYKTSQW